MNDQARAAKVKGFLNTGSANNYLPALEQVSDLIDRFQSPLGMELLVSVDWLVSEGLCELTLPGRHFHANLYSYVEHDCVIGDFVTFAPGVKCNGNVVVEDYAYAACLCTQGKFLSARAPMSGKRWALSLLNRGPLASSVHKGHHPYRVRCFVHFVDQPVAFVGDKLARAGNLPGAAEHGKIAELGGGVEEYFVKSCCRTGVFGSDIVLDV